MRKALSSWCESTVNVRVGRRTGSRAGRSSQASRTEPWVESAGPLGRVGREEGSWRRLRACPFHQGHQQTRRSGPSGGRGMDRLRDQCCGNSNGVALSVSKNGRGSIEAAEISAVAGLVVVGVSWCILHKQANGHFVSAMDCQGTEHRV